MSIKDKILKIFNPNQNVTKGSNDFDIAKAPNSTGNTFEFLKAIEAANQATFNSTGQYLEQLNADTSLDLSLDSFLSQRSLQDWFLLQIQANYYCNSINFKVSNPLYWLEIKKVIRAAFIYGKAGMYYDDFYKKWFPVLVFDSDQKYKLYKIRKVEEELKLNELKYDYLNIKYEDANLVIFHWGDNDQSALIYHYPFIRLQNQLLKQISISSLVLSKKLLYKTNGPNPSLLELKNWLNPFKFILNVFNTTLSQSKDKNGGGKFEWVENQGISNVKNEIEFYNELIKIWYGLYGRRVNDDFKKERNISNEVDASQENYDILQSNYIDCFKIFITTLKLHPHGELLGEIYVA